MHPGALQRCARRRCCCCPPPPPRLQLLLPPRAHDPPSSPLARHSRCCPAHTHTHTPGRPDFAPAVELRSTLAVLKNCVLEPPERQNGPFLEGRGHLGESWLPGLELGREGALGLRVGGLIGGRTALPHSGRVARCDAHHSSSHLRPSPPCTADMAAHVNGSDGQLEMRWREVWKPEALRKVRAPRCRGNTAGAGTSLPACLIGQGLHIRPPPPTHTLTCRMRACRCCRCCP